jgi:hypothetical protein
VLVNTSYWPLALIELTAAKDEVLLPIADPEVSILIGWGSVALSSVRSSRISSRGRQVGRVKRRRARRRRREGFEGSRNRRAIHENSMGSLLADDAAGIAPIVLLYTEEISRAVFFVPV